MTKITLTDEECKSLKTLDSYQFILALGETVIYRVGNEFGVGIFSGRLSFENGEPYLWLYPMGSEQDEGHPFDNIFYRGTAPR